jgi:nitrate reductase gamma subunit
MGPWSYALFKLAFWAALAVAAAGLAWRAWRQLATPAPFFIALAPAPEGRLGAAGRAAAGALGLAGWRRRPAAWLAAAGLHLGLAAALIGHLRWFTAPVPAWAVHLGQAGRWGGWVLAASLLALWLRRLAFSRLAALSRPADHLFLAWLAAVALSGLALGGVARPDPLAAKAAALALVGAGPAAPPPPALALHALLGLGLLAAAPFTRLAHGALAWLNPLRWQHGDPRLGGRPVPWESEHRGDAPSQEALRPGEDALWGLEAYRGHLKRRWAAGGTRRVLGARQRAAGPPDGGAGR